MTDETLHPSEPEPSTTAAVASAPDVPAPAPDDLDSLLAEFDKSAPAQRLAPDIAPSGDQNDALPKSFYEQAAAEDADAMRRAKEGPQLEYLSNAVTGLQTQLAVDRYNVALERKATVDKNDFAAIVKHANDTIPELANLPPGYAEMYLRTEGQTNAALARAWNDRYSSPAAVRIFEQTAAKVLRELANTARRTPDPIATADRDAVTAAVRGASGRTPAEPPPNFSKMSDAEFQSWKDKAYGH